MKRKNTISVEDLKLILVTDSIQEVLTFIKDQSLKKYGLLPERRPSPVRWLLEHS